MNKDIQNGKRQSTHTRIQGEKNKSIIGALFGLVKAFVPDTDDDEKARLNVGDWVEIIPEGEFGEIINIYEEKTDGFKYEVLFERDIGNNEIEDIDVFRRNKLRKIK